MSWVNWAKITVLSGGVLLAGVDCPYQAAPDRFISQQARIRQAVYEQSRKVGLALSTGNQVRNAAPAQIPRRNFIDDEIFGKLESMGVPSAQLTTDEEFLRRIYLDLIGRTPTATEQWDFLQNSSPNKRDDVIDSLLYSVQFTERWTMWFGDLLQNTASSTNINRGIDARNAFHTWIRASVNSQKLIRDMAWEAVASSGNSTNELTAGADFAIGSQTPNGPQQDTTDTMLARTASAFFGISHYDCLLCHNGRGHLDQISLWGSSVTRLDAERMAAFFSRLRTNRFPDDPPNTNRASDLVTGQYDLNTTYGNRPVRAPVGSVKSLTPVYLPTGAVPKDGNWRAAFADLMIRDPMFPRNMANRLWKQMFNLGLVDPVDQMDPARLDPNKPPPAPWTLQATHPQLLEKLAQEMVRQDYSLREFLRLLVQSSAYQLSSRYPGDWKIDYVPLFARHYPRRLEGEEIHDVITQATGIPGVYTVQGYDTVTSAIRLPEPVEPRSNSAVANFMNYFFRGNRDTTQRNQAGSVQQQLALMNDNFVASRVRVSASPVLQEISRIANNYEVVDQIYARFLARGATSDERSKAVAALTKAGVSSSARNTVIEDLAWVCINKLDFIFSY